MEHARHLKYQGLICWRLIDKIGGLPYSRLIFLEGDWKIKKSVSQPRTKPFYVRKGKAGQQFLP